MKTFGIGGMLFCVATLVQAQEQLRIWQGGDDVRVTTRELLFDGTSFSAEGVSYSTSSVDSIALVHTVTVTYSGSTATVDLGHAPEVTYTVDGAHVSILSTYDRGELEFVLKGQSTQGSLTYDGPLKCHFYLDGLNLKSDRGAAIDIQCGKRVIMELMPGTDNYLSDAAGGLQKAALYCKGHLELSGSGNLTVSGNAKHGIATKEYLQLKRTVGTVMVSNAVSDGIHAGQYFLMNGGTLVLTNQKGDGLQVEKLMLADGVTPDPTKENNGQIFVNGGTLTVTAASDDVKGIRSPGDMTVTGGTFNVTASGAGTKGISVTGNMLINQDSATTLMQIKATGGKYEDEVTEEESRCMGIKVAGNLTVNAGTIRVSYTGKGSRGIKINGTYTKSAAASVTANIKND